MNEQHGSTLEIRREKPCKLVKHRAGFLWFYDTNGNVERAISVGTIGGFWPSGDAGKTCYTLKIGGGVYIADVDPREFGAALVEATA